LSLAYVQEVLLCLSLPQVLWKYFGIGSLHVLGVWNPCFPDCSSYLIIQNCFE